MVSTRKKRQSNGSILSYLDDHDQDLIIGNAVNERPENNTVNSGTNDRNFIVGTSNKNSATIENALNVKTLERCFNQWIDREMNKIVDTVDDRIQNAIFTDIDNTVAPQIQLAIRSKNAYSGRDATSVAVNSECGKHAGLIASFGNASGNNGIQKVSNGNDETRDNILDEVSELSVPETLFDRQTHTHHIVTGKATQTNQISEFLTGRILTPHNPPSHQYQTHTRQRKNHKKIINQWLNKHQEIKAQTHTIPLIVQLMQLLELQPNNNPQAVTILRLVSKITIIFDGKHEKFELWRPIPHNAQNATRNDRSRENQPISCPFTKRSTPNIQKNKYIKQENYRWRANCTD